MLDHDRDLLCSTTALRRDAGVLGLRYLHSVVAQLRLRFDTRMVWRTLPFEYASLHYQSALRYP
jgi:hypothetical protein